MEDAKLARELKKTKKHINALTELLLKSGVDRPPQRVIDELLVPLCRLTKIVAPDVRQKLDEHLYAAENAQYEVNPNQHGADLIEKETGSRTELKVATCILNPSARRNKNGVYVKPTVKASVMWPMPKYDSQGDQVERRRKVLASIKAKTDHGGAVIRVVNGMQVLLKEYHLSHLFLMGYFERANLGTSTAYNMGGPLCIHCDSFHRLDRLQVYSNKMDLSPDHKLSREDWLVVLGNGKKNDVCPKKVKVPKKPKEKKTKEAAVPQTPKKNKKGAKDQ